MPDPHIASLGRISGALLSPNLLRHGADLAFDTDLLYLKVPPQSNLTVSAGSFISGQTYQIKTVGSTNFISIGASSNTVGVRFTASFVGADPTTGTGTAYYLRDDRDPNPVVSSGEGIGINKDNPVYEFDVNGNSNSTNVIVQTQAVLDNVVFNSSGTITTTVGPLEIRPSGASPTIALQRMTSDNLVFNDNTIASVSNSNIVVNPNGNGRVILESSTNITGNLRVTTGTDEFGTPTVGNIQAVGNLTFYGNITVGDSPLDVVTIPPDFTQSIIPGTASSYDLGSSPRRWRDAWVHDLSTTITVRPQEIKVSDQMHMNGRITIGHPSTTIFAMQSNEDIYLSPDTGITYIEQTKWQNSDITNLSNSIIHLTTTGTGYIKFVGNNAMVIPVGETYERPENPAVGATRWNTTLEYLECFDGTVWAVATGGGEEITVNAMQDLGNIYTLILG